MLKVRRDVGFGCSERTFGVWGLNLGAPLLIRGVNKVFHLGAL